MKKNMATITFENRDEIQELLNVIDRYVKLNPKEIENKILEEFYVLIEMMDYEW